MLICITDGELADKAYLMVLWGIKSLVLTSTVHMGNNVPQFESTANVFRNALKCSVYLIYFPDFLEALGPVL